MVLRHEVDRFGGEYSAPVEFATSQHHAQEAGVVDHGADQAAPTLVELGHSALLPFDRHERTVGETSMHRRHAIGRHRNSAKGGVVHAERLEDVFGHILTEHAPGHRFDHLADPVDTDPVLPPFTGVEHQRLAKCSQPPAAQWGHPAVFDIALGFGVPDVVGEPRGVGQEVSERDRRARRPQEWLTIAIPAVEHLDRFEFGSHARRRRVEFEQARLHGMHGGHTGQRLCHRVDRTDGVDRHRIAGTDRPFAGGTFVLRCVGIDNDRNDAWDVPSRNRSPENPVDLSLHLGEVTALSRRVGTQTDSA